MPPSDTEESLTDGYYEMQPVLIQANVPTENAANLQNDNYHIHPVDHGNVEYHIQNQSWSSSPHIEDTVDHDNIELDAQNEPTPSSAHLEVPNMLASLEMKVPNMDSSSDNDDNDKNLPHFQYLKLTTIFPSYVDGKIMMILVMMKKTIPILSQIRIFNHLCQLRITLEILMTWPIIGYGKFEIQEHHLHHLLEHQDSYCIP